MNSLIFGLTLQILGVFYQGHFHIQKVIKQQREILQLIHIIKAARHKYKIY